MSLINIAIRPEPPIYDEKTYELFFTDTGQTLARGLDLKTAELLRQGIDARDVLLRTVGNFPSFCFCDEHEQEEINGGDLVEWTANEFYALYESSPAWRALIEGRAKYGTPNDYDGINENETREQGALCNRCGVEVSEQDGECECPPNGRT